MNFSFLGVDQWVWEKKSRRGGSRDGTKRLYRLIASTTFPSSNDIRYKDKNNKEAKCYAHHDGNKKVQVRISKAFFGCRKNKKTNEPKKKKKTKKKKSKGEQISEGNQALESKYSKEQADAYIF